MGMGESARYHEHRRSRSPKHSPNISQALEDSAGSTALRHPFATYRTVRTAYELPINEPDKKDDMVALSFFWQFSCGEGNSRTEELPAKVGNVYIILYIQVRWVAPWVAT